VDRPATLCAGAGHDGRAGRRCGAAGAELFVDEEQVRVLAACIAVTAIPDPHGYTSSAAGITVTSNPLKWSTFAIACQRALGLAVGESEREALRGASAGTEGRVLVAEDNPINQALIAAQLDKLGYACDVVANGKQALDALEQRSYDLLITDCHMPLMDGYELARAVRRRENHSGHHLLVLAMTANAIPGELERCTSAGMDDFLPKPVRMPELRTKLERLFGASTATVRPVFEVDLGMLRESFGDDEVIQSLVTGFVRTTRVDLLTLDVLVDQRRPLDVAHWVHRLLGGLQLFGSNPLTEEGQALEQALKSEDRYEVMADALAFRRRVEGYLDRLELVARAL
jgi:two-component system sensor histidine kinase EvgS